MRDLTAGTVQTHAKTIEVKEYANDKYFSDFDTYATWFHTYYLSLAPKKAIDAMTFFAHADPDIRNKSFHQMNVFFGKLFSDNQYLIPYLLKSYQAQDADTKTVILATLPYIKHDFSSFISQLTDNEQLFYAKWLEQRLTYPDSGIAAPATLKEAIKTSYQLLDMLWSYFFASGEYRPIKQLVDVLDLAIYKGSLDKFKQTQSPADEGNAAKELIYKAARWSLESNIRQHKLVKDYSEFIYAKEDLSPQAKQELKEALGKQ